MTSPVQLGHSAQAVNTNVTVCMMKDVRVLQASVCVYLAGQVCVVHSSVQRERGAFSATRPAPASTAPPVRHIREPACANPDSGALSVNTCVVLVSLERGAVVNVHHVYMLPPVIT